MGFHGRGRCKITLQKIEIIKDVHDFKFKKIIMRCVLWPTWPQRLKSSLKIFIHFEKIFNFKEKYDERMFDIYSQRHHQQSDHRPNYILILERQNSSASM